MPVRCLARSAVFTVLTAMILGFMTTAARTQGADDINALNGQMERLFSEAKYAEALDLARAFAAATEGMERATAGGPGIKTAEALGELAWYALHARNFDEALAAAERAGSLAPDQTWLATNRAHALLFLGRIEEARALYLAHKGKRLFPDSDKPWEDVVADDFETLRKAGLDHAAFDTIVAALGINSALDQEVRALNGQVYQLYREGKYAQLIPLAERYVVLAGERYGEERTEFATAIGWLGVAYYSQGRYGEAEPLLKRALAITDKALGSDHPSVGTSLNSLAELYRAQGRSAEAEPLLKRALTITEKALGPDHPDVATRLHGLADLYRAQGRYGEAEPVSTRSLAIREKALGPDHPDVAASLDDLAALYRTQGRYDEAEPLFKRALAIREKALGPDHPDVGTSLDELAALYRIQGRYSDAEPLFERALAIREKALGPDHPVVGTSLEDLAELYRALGRYDEAEPLLKRALAIRERALGIDHPDVATSLNSLAELYRDRGRYSEAQPLFKRALAIRETALGPDHRDVGTSLNSLAQLYRAQGRYDDAEPLYKHALGIVEKALGPDHADLGAALNNLAGLYHDQGRYDEAELLYKRALTVWQKALGADHRYVGAALNNLALLYWTQRRYGEAEPLYQRALAVWEKALGPDHPNVGAALNNLAGIYRDQGRYADAEPLYKRALAVWEKALGSDHRDVGSALDNLAVLYQAQGRYGEAEPLFKRALAIIEKALGPDHPLVGTSFGDLARLYFEQSDWANAAESWRRSTNVIIRRAQRGTLDLGQPLTGRRKSEAEQLSWQFSGLVKVAYRLALDHPNLDQGLRREMFQTAQWAQSSEAAQTLQQMAARGAKGDLRLAALVRERQDLVAEWQKRDGDRNAAVAQAPDKRDVQAEAVNLARLSAIDTRIGEIDTRLAVEFPDYAAMVSPKPLSIGDVQALLGADEALVLILDTSEWKPTPEETFVWVVTKTKVRWVRSELGTPSLRRAVAALRCGLDYDGTWGAKGSWCSALLKMNYTEADYENERPLPFDLARAHGLYKALFGQIEDLIKHKDLLIVPSGALTQLPFQILVQSLPKGVSSVQRSREVGRLGAEFANLSDEERKRLRLTGEGGVRIVRVEQDSAARSAGLKPEDIVLSFEGAQFANWQNLVETIWSQAPGAKVQFRIQRDATELVINATLGATKIREWSPRFLATSEGKSISWLTREHAITVLPAVSSLKALRHFAKQSRATQPFIGFGNPLLVGPDTRYTKWASAARSKQSCPKAPEQRIAALIGERRGVLPLTLRGGRADVAQIRSQVPLPETADELCAVARDLGVGGEAIRLGERATETEIKRLSETGELSKYRVIHFATHGALAGQISGNSEPGLILTPPDVATEADDGYLSASEIAALKLDADWVILSACNTAAGGAEGAESLSGLARAFFYAGARALLVSHWSVYSDSTVKLITNSVRRMATNRSVGRAEAMRQSMIAMIEKGRPYEAHPAHWAPFVVVGEGGAAR